MDAMLGRSASVVAKATGEAEDDAARSERGQMVECFVLKGALATPRN